jgi:hypothetical protein
VAETALVYIKKCINTYKYNAVVLETQLEKCLKQKYNKKAIRWNKRIHIIFYSISYDLLRNGKKTVCPLVYGKKINS